MAWLYSSCKDSIRLKMKKRILKRTAPKFPIQYSNGIEWCFYCIALALASIMLPTSWIIMQNKYFLLNYFIFAIQLCREGLWKWNFQHWNMKKDYVFKFQTHCQNHVIIMWINLINWWWWNPTIWITIFKSEAGDFVILKQGYCTWSSTISWESNSIVLRWAYLG